MRGWRARSAVLLNVVVCCRRFWLGKLGSMELTSAPARNVIMAVPKNPVVDPHLTLPSLLPSEYSQSWFLWLMQALYFRETLNNSQKYII